MKNIFILFLLLIFINPVLASGYQPETQADIIHNAQNNLIKSNKHFDVVCDRIKNNFANDKKFLTYFEKDLKNFIEYKNLQRDMVLPETPIAYGSSNYYIYSDWYMDELNKQKLDFYKNAVKTYCSHIPYNGTENNACSEKNINLIFK